MRGERNNIAAASRAGRLRGWVRAAALGAGLASLSALGLSRVLTDRIGAVQLASWVPGLAYVGAAAAALGAALLLRPRAASCKRRSERLLGAALLLGVLWLGLAEWRLLNTFSAGVPQQPRAGDVRVLTWNPSVTGQEELERDIAPLHPDIVLLANPSYARSLQPVADALREQRAALGKEPGPLSFVRRERLAALSRFPLLRHAFIPSLNVTGSPTRTHTWNLPSGSGTLVNVDRGQMLLLEYDTRDALGRTTVVWLIDLPSDPRIPRTRMMREARAAIDAFRGAVLVREEGELGRDTPDPDQPTALARLLAPDVVAGDFNTPRNAASLRTLLPGMHSAFESAGRGMGLTFPLRPALVGIDHTYAAPTLRVSGYALRTPRVGKHKIQVADLRTATAR